MKKRISSLIISIVLCVTITQAQDKYAFSNKIVDIQFLYNYNLTSGDIAKTFGNFNGIGIGGVLKSKQNWILSAEFSYLFGKDMKVQSILDNLVTSGGYLASNSGSPANYAVNMRGYTGFVKAGRLFGINKFNMNSGFMVQAGIGFLQHRINFQSQANDIPQLNNDFQKGYDRLTYGVAINEFIGYCYHSKSRLINFYVGVDLTQGFTKNRRGFNYDEQAYDKAAKTDLLTAFRFGWMIPIYLNTKDENEFYFR